MILSIDPSIRHVGWATRSVTSNLPYWDHGTINIPQGKQLPDILVYIVDKLNAEACCGDPPSKLIIEFPEFFQGSEKGAIAAVQGTVLALPAIAGFLQAYYKLHPSKVFHYRPSEWKGQVPKKGMLYRFEQCFGYKAKTDHEAEAALLLNYHLNLKNKR